MEPANRFVFNIPVQGSDAVVELDLIEATPEEWAQMPESVEKTWTLVKDRHQNRLFAARLLGVPIVQVVPGPLTAGTAL